MSELNDLTWGGLALSPVILLIIEGLKQRGMPASFAPIANMWLSAIFQAAVFVLATHYPTAESATLAAVQSIALFLTTAGLYDRFQAYFSKR